jgi:diguanylate cyclase (GGDEF)-like protein
MMDIDKFKVYNDTYGHQQGDVVLKSVAKVFSQTLMRAVDFAARWGGEEFVVLLPNTPVEGAMGVAERIRENVEKAEIPCADGSTTKVTISIGVATQTPEKTSLVDTFVQNADQALYAAKNQGRNRVVHSSS